MELLKFPEHDFALDNTGKRLMDACERKYLQQIILGYRTRYGSPALRYGSTFHGFKEGYYSHIKQNGWLRDGGAIDRAANVGRKAWEESTDGLIFDETDYRTFSLCFESFLECLSEFSSDEDHLRVMDTEKIFVYHPEIPSKILRKYPILHGIKLLHTGKLDLQAELSGVPWIFEFKTTGGYVDQQMERLHRNSQVMGYSFAGARALNYKPEGIFVLIHQATCRKSPKTGEWGRITRAYKRTPMIFTEEDLENWFESYVSTAERIVRCYENSAWPMRHDRCYEFGRCVYCNLCERNLSLEELIDEPPQGFVVKKWDVRDSLEGDD